MSANEHGRSLFTAMSQSKSGRGTGSKEWRLIRCFQRMTHSSCSAILLLLRGARKTYLWIDRRQWQAIVERVVVAVPLAICKPEGQTLRVPRPSDCLGGVSWI